MKQPVVLLILLLMPIPVVANHTWAEIDLCEVYKDQLPPGLTAAQLPEAGSSGAVLLNRYCTQCHNLPGPDRHTAAEWHELATRMFNLMDVAHRFGGLMGSVESLRPQQRATLLAYLLRNAGDGSITPGSDAIRTDDTPILVRLHSLLPLLLLAGLGLMRWWRKESIE
ncbi:MAG: hypothetical protein AB2598_07135 [Candidatus Thiodiazotropha sp.]